MLFIIYVDYIVGVEDIHLVIKDDQGRWKTRV